MLRDVQKQYGSNLPTPFFLDFEKPHGFLAYALLSTSAQYVRNVANMSTFSMSAQYVRMSLKEP